MSAPIDDLLYGGDDSGDEDELPTSTAPMRSFPLSAAVTPPGGLLAPAAIVPPVAKLPTPSPIRPQPQPKLPTPGKQTPGSGQQMFQQMFALLKQMLPVEQYATLHSEMRKGNGNDIKSIVDIIKRIAGDAIFSSVIQKMDLTRTFPTANTPGAFSGVKPEPGVVGLTSTSPGGMGRPLSTTTASPKPTAIAPNTRPIAAAPPTLAVATPVAMPASIAAALPPPILPPPGIVSTSPAKVAMPGVKSEPLATTSGAATTASSPNSSSAVAQSRNEALEKIMFAKRLLSHAATCSLAHGMCQVKKCDDVRRVFKHSLSCGGANGCSHCEQLKGLVKYHAKECAVGITEHCSIPFCDGLRPASAPVAPQKNVTANMTQEYGRLLQLILHVEKCTTSACPVGEECAESKTIMQQMNSSNPPARANTYKQVYGHYKTCVAKNNTGNCPMCKIGLLPILTTAPTGSAVSSSPSGGFNKRGSSAVSPTPRSPLKKPRTNSTSRGRSTAEVAALSAAASDLVSQELAQASVADIRREADVLTHTNIELGSERRIMMEGGVRRVRMAEQLPCQKEEWVEKDLFNSETLRTQMREVGRRSGVELGGHTSEVMAYALHEYLKQAIEEMVEVSKQRGDSQAKSLEALQKAHRVGARMDGRPGSHMELTATDILRVSCEDSFTKLRQEDLSLRAQLLEDAKREEQIEKERAKKRKKVDRSKLNQDERDEAEMDVEELAVKDLKERLLQQDKGGVLKVDGRVNESISAKFAPRDIDNQVTMEDANYWLLSQKPYIRPKLFVRAEAARIVTKSLL
uniref:histone acetyltransferase n=1 Tax=Phytophthora ramorum TaxID=164328 RepID=H3GYG5_PHYRM